MKYKINELARKEVYETFSGGIGRLLLISIENYEDSAMKRRDVDERQVTRLAFRQLHKDLVRRGYFRSASKLLNFMRKGFIHIYDGDNELYESGLADFLMERFTYTNGKYSAEIHIRNPRYEFTFGM